jgi:hypothetical protein
MKDVTKFKGICSAVLCPLRKFGRQIVNQMAMSDEIDRSILGRYSQVMKNPIRYFKSSPEIIRDAVLLDIRYPLSLRSVEDIRAERGIDICMKLCVCGGTGSVRSLPPGSAKNASKHGAASLSGGGISMRSS